MEDYWNSQSPSLFSMQYKSGEMPMLGPKMNHTATYQRFEFPSTFNNFIPHTVTSSEAEHSLQSPGVYQILNLDTTVSTDTSRSPPTSSDCQEGQDPVNCAMVDAKSPKFQSQTQIKRRIQNRDAQRRFRGRKEVLHQTLQQRTKDLEMKCEELSNRFTQKSEEVSQILKEKEALTVEIQDLRKRWRLMLMLLRLPNRIQSLSTLLGSDLSSTSGSSISSPPLQSAAKAESLDMPLEDLLGCLQELLLPNETPNSSSPLSSSS